jgi:hypothetical protein
MSLIDPDSDENDMLNAEGMTFGGQEWFRIHPNIFIYLCSMHDIRKIGASRVMTHAP